MSRLKSQSIHSSPGTAERQRQAILNSSLFEFLTQPPKSMTDKRSFGVTYNTSIDNWYATFGGAVFVTWTEKSHVHSSSHYGYKLHVSSKTCKHNVCSPHFCYWSETFALPFLGSEERKKERDSQRKAEGTPSWGERQGQCHSWKVVVGQTQ